MTILLFVMVGPPLAVSNPERDRSVPVILTSSERMGLDTVIDQVPPDVSVAKRPHGAEAELPGRVIHQLPMPFVCSADAAFRFRATAYPEYLVNEFGPDGLPADVDRTIVPAVGTHPGVPNGARRGVAAHRDVASI